MYLGLSITSESSCRPRPRHGLGKSHGLIISFLIRGRRFILKNLLFGIHSNHNQPPNMLVFSIMFAFRTTWRSTKNHSYNFLPQM